MSDVFQKALHTTAKALEPMRERAKRPTASVEALQRLKERPARRPRSPVEPLGTEEISTRTATGLPKISATGPVPRLAPRDCHTLDALREAALACVQCPHLVAARTGVVFGVGNPNAELMFVGEAPGADEDAQGEPFVGRAGQLLTKIIQAMNLTREDVYIGNVLKCRPDMPPGESGNRKPKAEEMRTCLPWLERQIELIGPKALVALGATAAEGLLGAAEPMGKLRGRWLEFRGIPTMVTYHPAYLLRNQSISEKRKVWEDMLLVLKHLGHPISAKQRKFFTSPDS